jgi:hypothetical protein
MRLDPVADRSLRNGVSHLRSADVVRERMGGQGENPPGVRGFRGVYKNTPKKNLSLWPHSRKDLNIKLWYA